MLDSKVKHDWYQTETLVVIEVRIKGLKPETVKVEFGESSVSFSAPMPDVSGSEYCLDLDLAHPVVPGDCCFKVLSTKVEIKLKKRDGIRWQKLEGDGQPPLPTASALASAPASASSAPSQPPSYISSSGRNWSKITTEIEKELEDDKPEGEAALQELFNKIYRDADDDTRRAMNKSFQESGGTVLSTNWTEVGKSQVDVKPPDGMEFKKWE